jgi:hypothetical protein
MNLYICNLLPFIFWLYVLLTPARSLNLFTRVWSRYKHSGNIFLISRKFLNRFIFRNFYYSFRLPRSCWVSLLEMESPVAYCNYSTMHVRQAASFGGNSMNIVPPLPLNLHTGNFTSAHTEVFLWRNSKGPEGCLSRNLSLNMGTYNQKEKATEYISYVLNPFPLYLTMSRFFLFSFWSFHRR